MLTNKMNNKKILKSINDSIKDIQTNLKSLKQDLKNNDEYTELVWDLARIQENTIILKIRLFLLIKVLKNEN